MGDAATQTSNHKHVTIINELGHVDLEEVEVWFERGEQVIWKTPTGHPFRVVFDGPEGSPFDTDTFHVPAGGMIQSGQARRGGRFKYTVHGPGGANDPILNLHPP